MQSAPTQNQANIEVPSPGMATITNGSRQLSNDPAITCPIPIPSPVPVVITAAIADRWLAGYRSPNTE